MKLYYYKCPNGNFGDDINLWLWKRLFQKPLSQCLDENTLFIGIGTILDQQIPAIPSKKIVFGSGFGYGFKPRLTDQWEIICVRGPLTATALGLPINYAITDGAVLVRELLPFNDIRGDFVSFVPHHRSALLGDWKSLCESIDIKYIDPRGSVEEIISTIRKSTLVLAEAMHAAIIADTYRIPWIPICTSSKILKFKWLDWTKSLGIQHEFEYAPIPEFDRIFAKYPNITNKNFNVSLNEVRPTFIKILRNGKKKLSTDRVYNNVYNRMQESLNRFIEKI